MATPKKYYIDIFCQYCGTLATRKVKNQKGFNYPRYCKDCEKIPENVKRVGYFNDIINGRIVHLETETEHPVFVDEDAEDNGYYPIYASQNSWEAGLTTLWWYRPSQRLYSFVAGERPVLSSQYILHWEGEDKENRSSNPPSLGQLAYFRAAPKKLSSVDKQQSCLARITAALKSLLFSR